VLRLVQSIRRADNRQRFGRREPSIAVVRICAFISFVLCCSFSLAADWYTYRVFCPNAASVQKLADSSATLISERMGAVTEIAAPNPTEIRRLGLRFEQTGRITDPRIPYQRLTDGSDYKTEYLTNDEIILQFEDWRSRYPSLIQRDQIATTEQGRPVWVYRLHNPYSLLPSMGIFYHGLIHAREWISGSVCMYLFDSLLSDALSTGPGWQRITRFEFNVVPVLNPDGYAYSWDSFRLWRKNRRDNGNNRWGVDLNRNYPIGWGGVGSSGNPSSDTYRGPAPFSEPELAGLRDYLENRSAKVPLRYTLDYHSYGQYVIHPLGYTEDPAPDFAALNAIAHVYGAAVEATGSSNYTIGQSAVVQYPAGGTSEDYYYDQFGSLGGTIELRPTGSPGFELPPSQILPTAREHWAGFIAALAYLQ